MDGTDLLALRAEAITSIGQITDPNMKLAVLLKYAPEAGDEKGPLLDEAASIARGFEKDDERSLSLWQVYSAARKHL